MLGSGGGDGTAGTHSWLGRAQRRYGPGEQLSGSCGLFCVFPLSVLLLLLLFSLFAVLLNYPYPNPPVFCLFLSILFRTPAGGGAATWRFCCQQQPKPEHWVILLALFEDWSDTGFSSVLGHHSCPPGPFKDDGEWLSNDIRQLPQHSWVHSIRAHGFVGIQIA